MRMICSKSAKSERTRLSLHLKIEMIQTAGTGLDIQPVHKKQLLTYLRLADMRLGLLINFGSALLKDGISRVVNGL